MPSTILASSASTCTCAPAGAFNSATTPSHGAGKPVYRIEPVLEVVRDDVALEFVSPAGFLVRLKLVRIERSWVGTVGVSTLAGIRLEKVGD